MLKHRLTDRICAITLSCTILLTVLFMSAAATGVVQADNEMGYETRLFDQSRVHTIDIVMDGWDDFLETCVNEEYSSCTIVIDGEKYSNVGIRGKGNTSLSSVAAYGNNRYSFKVEFDQYTSGKTYYGLDKLSLNNIIQDYTYLKDYMAYTLMNEMGVASPLCSFVYITVNGSDWGLYLAVEAVEDGFLKRNYGRDYGELYKPDSLSFGGGRGNGMDFDMTEFREQFENSGGEIPQAPSDAQMPRNFTPPDRSKMSVEKGAGGFGGGMGSSDVKLQYSNDDPESYSNIFDNAKTDITDADKARLISSLKTLSEGENIESVVDVESVIRYLVVHNFVCNDDSYTGTMVHNYYLYEEDCVLSMIPWDYNLAIGGFNMGRGNSSDATSTVNSPIDSPVSNGDISSRPMVAWIFASEEYTALYHGIYAEFLAEFYESGWFDNELTRVIEMIAPYVERDPTAFCTYEQFQTASAALVEFCKLRCESVAGQLDGSIPSTSSGQGEDASALIDASRISLSDMGEFGMGGGGMGGGMPDMSGFTGGDMPDMSGLTGGDMPDMSGFSGGDMPDMSGFTGGDMPDMSGFTGGEAPDMSGFTGGETPESTQTSVGRGDKSQMGGDFSAAQQSPTASEYLLLAACVAVLIIGTIAARAFKGHN